MDFPCRKKRDTDLISDLPTEIIHRIFSFLPHPQVVRTTALSKKFRSLWRSYPEFVLRSDWFWPSIRTRNLTPEQYWEMAFACAFDSIQLRDEQSSKLRSFVFHCMWTLNSDLHLRVGSSIDRLVRWAFDHCAGEIDINFRSYGSYILLQPLVFSHCTEVRSVTALQLRGFQLDFQILLQNCPSLKHVALRSCSLLTGECVECAAVHLTNLEFYEAGITDQWLKGYLPKLTHLQHLKLRFCNQLKKIEVSSQQLRALHLIHCRRLQEAHINAPELTAFYCNGSLHSFKCFGYSASLHVQDWRRTEEIRLLSDFISIFHRRKPSDLAAGTPLKTLLLHCTPITGEWLKSHLPKFPYLQYLELYGCTQVKKIEISSQRLRTLHLHNEGMLEEANIDTPNLTIFGYHGVSDSLKHFSFSYSGSLYATLLLRSRGMDEHIRFQKSVEFLRAFNRCKKLILHNSRLQKLNFPKERRVHFSPPLHDLRSLAVGFNFLSRDQRHVDIELVEGLLWLCPHLEDLDITFSSTKMKSAKFRYDNKLLSEDNVICRRICPLECWRHYLESVVLENFTDYEFSSLRQFFTDNARILKRVERN